MSAVDVNVKEGVDQDTVDAVRSVGERYKYGWNSDIETEFAPKGLNEDIVRLISEKKGEPAWMCRCTARRPISTETGLPE